MFAFVWSGQLVLFKALTSDAKSRALGLQKKGYSFYGTKHVVPLAWAWDRGASAWLKEQREQFANDPVNLLPVEANLNRSKGAQGPDQWLPPTGQCGYVARFSRITKKYRLTLATQENRWIQSFLDDCRR